MSDADTAPQGDPVDLTNCDREPIHLLGRVQDYGCLVAVTSDWIISHASENCEAILGIAAETLQGQPFLDFFTEDCVHDLRTRMQMLRQDDGATRVYGFPAFSDTRLFDVTIHSSNRHFVFEFEPRDAGDEAVQDASVVQALVDRMRRQPDMAAMLTEAAKGLKALTGFDRVMVYRFEPDDSGTVVAEAANPGLSPYLGLRYPASDIPKQARALYVRSPIRLIADVDAPTHGLLPRPGPGATPLDLSLAATRAVSAIHLEYLRNMGVAASMSVSILRKGALWGLFACHHDSPRYIDSVTRGTVELFAQLVNYEIAQSEMERELEEIDDARALHDSLMIQLSSGGSLLAEFDMLADRIGTVIAFDGIAILSDGVFRAAGAAPTEAEFRALTRFLNATPGSDVYHTDHLALHYPEAASFVDRAAGALALPISRTPRDYLVLFRREVAQSVVWAGNPDKAVTAASPDKVLTPRRSFEAWKEIVRGKSTPWTPREVRCADALRVTLLEVVLKLSDERNASRKRSEEQQELLIAELNHRVRNILNLIRSLVSQGRGGAETIEQYSDVLDARIHALGRAHDQLTEKRWDWVPLRRLIRNEAAAFLAGRADRLEMAGADVELAPGAFTTMALVIHELVTNSVKYGALGTEGGRVAIALDFGNGGEARISWRESGGRPVRAPTRRGFGSTIIERSIPFELRGTADLRFEIGGLEADFTIPAPHVREARETEAPKAAAPSRAQSNAEARLAGEALVVEDNMIIALDAEDMLAALGASRVHVASRNADALAILGAREIGFALVDANLGEELSTPVVEHCLRTNIPVVLATGYGGQGTLSRNFPDVPILSKPYTVEHLRATLAALQTG